MHNPGIGAPGETAIRQTQDSRSRVVVSFGFESVHHMNSADEGTLKLVAEHVSRGECILFLGAGVHYPPPRGSRYQYPASKRPPLGGTLSVLLARKSNFRAQFKKDLDANLQRVSLYYETAFSRSQLVQEVKNAVFTGKAPSPALRGLAALNFPLIITTNYDQLLERSLEAVGKHPRVSVYSPAEYVRTRDYKDVARDRPFLFKIHGDIDRPDSLVITDEDYIQFILRMSDKDPFHPVPETLLYYFKKWPTLFVGYSLLDYDLRVLFKTLRWRLDRADIPDAYSVDPYPDPLIVEVWSNQRKYIRFIAQDVWRFVPRLYQTVIGKAMPR